MVIIHTETYIATADTGAADRRRDVSEQYPHGDGEFLPRQHNRLLALPPLEGSFFTARCHSGRRRNIKIRYKERGINVRPDQVVTVQRGRIEVTHMKSTSSLPLFFLKQKETKRNKCQKEFVIKRGIF